LRHDAIAPDQCPVTAGPGLDPSHLERVFDAFYTTKSGGMGTQISA
jgi:signal transduction histidine kinase